MNNPVRDVIIIGAGPAGCAAGIVAARGGLGVTVFDQASFPNHKVCGDAISNKAAQIVVELCGDRDAVNRLPHAIVHQAHAIFPDGTRIARHYGREHGYVVERSHLDGALRVALTAHGAELRTGTRVRRLLKDDAGRVVGVATDDAEWRARAVIAADGFSSVALAAAGQKPQRGAHVAFGITTYFGGLSAGSDPGVSEHYFEPDLPCGYFWIFPTVEGRANVGVYQRADRLRAGGVRLSELLDRFVDRHAARFTGARMVGTPQVRPLPLAVCQPRVLLPGLVLAGDAVHAIDPFTGEGIWQALHTGRLAGERIVMALGAASGLDLAAVTAHRHLLEREIFRPSRKRRRIENAITLLVSTGAYRLGPVRALLRWGYSRNALELSKTVETDPV